MRAVLCLVHVLHPCIGLTENIDASGVGMAFPVDIVIDSPEGEHVSIACEDEAAVFLRFRLFLPAGQFKMVDNWMLMIGTAQLGAAPEDGVSAGGKGALWRSAKELRVDSTSARPKQMMQYLSVRLGICDLVGPGTEGNDAEEEVRCMYASRLAGHPCAWKRPQAMFYEVLLIKRASAASIEERRQPSTGTFLGNACGFGSDGSVCEEGFLLGRFPPSSARHCRPPACSSFACLRACLRACGVVPCQMQSVHAYTFVSEYARCRSVCILMLVHAQVFRASTSRLPGWDGKIRMACQGTGEWQDIMWQGRQDDCTEQRQQSKRLMVTEVCGAGHG